LLLFGFFFGVVSIIEFLIKTTISGRLINKYGIRLGLIILPVILILITALSLMSGTLLAGSGLFFSFIAVNKLVIRAIRTAFYDPCFQILYQIIDEKIRLAYQNVIEGFSKSAGNILSGLVLIALMSLKFLNLIHFNFFYLAIVVVWFFLVISTYREYKSKLKSILRKGNAKNSSSQTIDHRILNQIKTKMKEDEVSSFKFSFYLIENLFPLEIESIIKQNLQNKNQQIQDFILNKILTYKLFDFISLLSESQNFQQEIIEKLKKYQSVSLEEIEKLVHSEKSTDRIQAVYYITRLKRLSTYKSLILLLNDPLPEVKRAAMRAARNIRQKEVHQLIISQLSDPSLVEIAVSLLQGFGETVLQGLESSFQKNEKNQSLRIRIIRLYGKIGGSKAVKFLRERINSHDALISHEAIKSLVGLNYRCNSCEIPVIKQAIEKEVGTLVWIIASLFDTYHYYGKEHPNELQKALGVELDNKKENIMLYLSLIYKRETIEYLEQNLFKTSNQASGYALEIVDITLDEDLRELLQPIFEDISLSDKLTKYKNRFPQAKTSFLQRLIEILMRDFSEINIWTKSCALDALREFNLESTRTILATFFNHPHPLIQEIAQLILLEKNEKVYQHLMNQLKKDPAKYLKNEEIRNNKRFSKMEMISFIKEIDIFFSLPEELIIDLAVHCEEIQFPQSDQVFLNDPEFFYLLCVGEVRFLKENQPLKVLNPLIYWGMLKKSEYEFQQISIEIKKGSKILRLHKSHLFNLCKDYPQIINDLYAFFNF